MMHCILDPELECQDPDGEIYCGDCSYFQAMTENAANSSDHEEQGKAIII